MHDGKIVMAPTIANIGCSGVDMIAHNAFQPSKQEIQQAHCDVVMPSVAFGGWLPDIMLLLRHVDAEARRTKHQDSGAQHRCRRGLRTDAQPSLGFDDFVVFVHSRFGGAL